ncbi:MAG: hypothetical protein RL536_470 [Candidatus Parcubacteria bacterium]|jgi:hypothetical protein
MSFINPRGTSEMEEVMKKGIAQRVVDGSDRINSMRKTIERCVSTLAGFIVDEGLINPSTDALSECGELLIEAWSGPHCLWWHIGRSGKVYFVLSHTSRTDSLGLYNTINGNEPRLLDVQHVYNCLDCLVDGLVKKYPVLAQRLKPLLEAAE